MSTTSTTPPPPMATPLMVTNNTDLCFTCDGAAPSHTPQELLLQWCKAQVLNQSTCTTTMPTAADDTAHRGCDYYNCLCQGGNCEPCRLPALLTLLTAASQLSLNCLVVIDGIVLCRGWRQRGRPAAIASECGNGQGGNGSFATALVAATAVATAEVLHCRLGPQGKQAPSPPHWTAEDKPPPPGSPSHTNWYRGLDAGTSRHCCW